MRVLILGGNGMLGHKVWQEFSKQGELDTYVTLRSNSLFFTQGVIQNVDVSPLISSSRQGIVNILDKKQPDVVINCIGIVKQLERSAMTTISINSLFPHWLAKLCRVRGIRMIHISTDCVFSGKVGNYSESDSPSPVDLYGQTKLTGEVVDKENCLTLRTSFIGRELVRKVGLFEWFLSQSGGVVEGYANVIFSGLITAELASVLVDIVLNHPTLEGLYHISGHPISKYNLLKLINETLGLKINVMKHSGIHIDRSLNSDKLRKILKYQPLSWNDMIQRLCVEL